MDSDGYSSDSSNSLIVDNSDLIDRRVSSSSSTNGTKSSAKEFRGVRVLLVDYDTVALHVILKMLKMFDYEAIGITGGLHGLKLLREKPYYFDLVVAAVHMPGMSGLELLQGIKLEFTTLPVILVSNDTDPEMAAKGISNGAAYFLHKPVSHCDVENMWKHVHKSKADETVNKNRYKEQTGSIVGQDSLRRKEKHRRVSGGDDEGNSQVESRKRKKGFVKDQPSDDKRNKKGRVVWTAQLHTDFLNAIENLGVDSAVPKKILEYMKVPGLTRENVASHLQVCFQLILSIFGVFELIQSRFPMPIIPTCN
ncbi:hypothetical protein MKX01_025187 [Papaver californicum]|nr:hypothetical protein MKX01_025187 [Papaver californicum]